MEVPKAGSLQAAQPSFDDKYMTKVHQLGQSCKLSRRRRLARHTA
jgi:hypothetical protein